MFVDRSVAGVDAMNSTYFGMNRGKLTLKFGRDGARLSGMKLRNVKLKNVSVKVERPPVAVRSKLGSGWAAGENVTITIRGNL